VTLSNVQFTEKCYILLPVSKHTIMQLFALYFLLDILKFLPPIHFEGTIQMLHCGLMLTVCLSVCPTAYLSVCLSIYLSIYLTIYPRCSHLEHRTSLKRFVSLQFLNLRQSVGPLGREISPTQGRYLHRTTQIQNKRKHPYLEWDSNPRSQRLSGRRYFMP
jgi:hypothetical protein